MTTITNICVYMFRRSTVRMSKAYVAEGRLLKCSVYHLGVSQIVAYVHINQWTKLIDDRICPSKKTRLSLALTHVSYLRPDPHVDINNKFALSPLSPRVQRIVLTHVSDSRPDPCGNAVLYAVCDVHVDDIISVRVAQEVRVLPTTS